MTFENPILVDSIQAERAHLAAHPCACGGQWQVTGQSLCFDADRNPFDLIDATCAACGGEAQFCFDISRFFGVR